MGWLTWNGSQPWYKQGSYDHGIIIAPGGDGYYGTNYQPFYVATTNPYPYSTFAPPPIVHHQQSMVSFNANTFASQQHGKQQSVSLSVPLSQSDGSPTTTTKTSSVPNNDNVSKKPKKIVFSFTKD